MDWLKNIAPTLGMAIAGPLGGAAVSILAEKLNMSEKTEKAVTDFLHASPMQPDQIAAIRHAELEFQKFLEQNKIDIAKIHNENTQGARAMLEATRSRTPEILSFIITIGFFGILSYMLTMEARPGEPLLIMLGSLGTAWIAVVNFWFGSSSGSVRKSELMAQSKS